MASPDPPQASRPTRAPRRRALPAIALLALIAITAVTLFFLIRSDPLAPALEAYQAREWRRAYDLARELTTRQPANEAAQRIVARAAARLQRDSLAQSLYQRLGPDGASAEDFCLLAQTLLRAGQPEPARRLLLDAEAREADHGETLAFLVRLDRDTGRVVEATPRARRLTTHSKWEGEANALLGLLLLEQDDAEAAADALKTALDTPDPNPAPLGSEPFDRNQITLQLARALLRAGRPEPALQALDRLPLSVLHSSEASWLRSRIALQRSDPWGYENASARVSPDPMRAEPAPYLGASSCTSCHADIAARQGASRHRETHRHATTANLRDRGISPQLAPRPDPGNPQLSHELADDNGRVRARVSAGPDARLEAFFDHAIGSGHRAVTFLARDSAGAESEYRLTHYAHGVGWDLTIHHALNPSRPDEYLGKAVTPDQLRTCLGCHRTTAISATDTSRPEALDTGIGCETCHGPGGHHVSAVSMLLDDPAIVRPRLASPAERLALCARCHDAPPGSLPDSRDFVRFQAPNLRRSRCYTATSGALDCVTCHDPHANAATDASHYNSTCLRCHAPSPATDALLPPSSPRTPCSVQPTGLCTSCHMPSVPEVLPHTAYTDHWIRSPSPSANPR